MGNAASRAKAKWNASRYKQVKVSVDPGIALAFKAACEAADVSMAGELSRFMAEYSTVAKKRKPVNVAADLSTRQKRRKSITEMISTMARLRDAESSSHDNVPENLRGTESYEATEESLSVMDEVLNLLETIY